MDRPHNPGLKDHIIVFMHQMSQNLTLFADTTFSIIIIGLHNQIPTPPLNKKVGNHDCSFFQIPPK